MKGFRQLLTLFFITLSSGISAQDASVSSRIDANKITVGDQVKLFIEASHNAKQSKLQWAAIPDTFNSLEIVEKGKIDTVQQGDKITYKQRLLVTGFDSGSFKIPAFQFPVMPTNGTPYTIQTDSFLLLVQTVPVDTAQPFKGIKEIIPVKTSWTDYLWLIVGIIILILLATVVFFYFRKNRKVASPVPVVRPPLESSDSRALRLLNELEAQKLWQSDRIKEYYIQLSDIIRTYIEERFHTPALELTTDELLQKAKMHPEMRQQYDQLATILFTADLAKFAKAQPMPQEHTNAMELSKQFIIHTKQVTTTTTQQQ